MVEARVPSRDSTDAADAVRRAPTSPYNSCFRHTSASPVQHLPDFAVRCPEVLPAVVGSGKHATEQLYVALKGQPGNGGIDVVDEKTDDRAVLTGAR